ncbi:TetR/AcrR family transcriptional regulator [Nocardioides panacisoli]|uniref:HTH tetR-type domain-containing protein n=1 Tax=Nocardioides panacisoli TaxID=627624 RepID=A0ABP7IHK7_9ACTN
MAKDQRRREEWTGAATDYALEHGLIGLSLRPLAAALGTSDRMLLYHFGSKDHLVADVLRESNDRAIEALAVLPASAGPRRAVGDLWDAVRAPQVLPCTRLYVEAAALGLLGREPYASVVRQANARWVAALKDHLVRSGVDVRRAGRAVNLVDAAFLGFQLDAPLDVDERARRRVVADLARAVEALI